jgi:hypothetical protein
MSKHTPAPWVLKIRPAEHDDNVTVAEIEQPRSVKYRGAVTRMQSAEHIYGIGRDELIANARLIAAAPDMLEALKGLLADIQDYQRINNLGGDDNHWQAMARAAIAKAEGV